MDNNNNDYIYEDMHRRFDQSPSLGSGSRDYVPLQVQPPKNFRNYDMPAPQAFSPSYSVGGLPQWEPAPDLSSFRSTSAYSGPHSGPSFVPAPGGRIDLPYLAPQGLQPGEYGGGNRFVPPDRMYPQQGTPYVPISGNDMLYQIQMPSSSPRQSSSRQQQQQGNYQGSSTSQQRQPSNNMNLSSNSRDSFASNNSAKKHFSDGASSHAGGSNAQGRAINKMLLDIVRERTIDPSRLHLAIETFVDRMDCVNLATLLFHTGKKRFLLAPVHIKQIANRFNLLREELRSREASNALYGMKCLSSEVPEVRELIYAVANKIAVSTSDFVAQAVGNALYGCQMMTSEYDEVRYLLLVLSTKVNQCTELLEAQNVGNALYGMRGMNSDYREVRAIVAALAPKISKAKEELNGQALGNSLYGLQSMSSKEPEVRNLLTILAQKASRTWEELKAQEVGNALYGLKRMSTDVPEVRMLIASLVPKIASSPELLDAQAIGNSFYGLQNMKSDNQEVLQLLSVLAEKVVISNPELDGQAMGNSLYGLQGMSSEYLEVRGVVSALTQKIQSSCLEMNAQELGNALYGLQNMTSHHVEVRRLMLALATKISTSRHELTSQEIGNAIFGLQGMTSEHAEVRYLIAQLGSKIHQSHSVLDPQGVSNSLFGLQKLSSESAEVQSLLHALSFKVEQCWKTLGSHHVAHACFGLQSLSSESVDVRQLLKVLVPKIVACREEMSPKQLSHALYGLQSMTSNSVEVQGLITALSEKVAHCRGNNPVSGLDTSTSIITMDIWGVQHLALTYYGLQGMNSDVEEVSLLLNLLNQKMSFSSFNDADATSLGNMIFGMQRFNSRNVEVQKLINFVVPATNCFVQHLELLNLTVCSNMLFGIQGLSCSLEPVRKIVDLLLNAIQVNFEMVRNAGSLAQSYFADLMTLFQTATISLFALPDLDNFIELQSKSSILLLQIENYLVQNEMMYVPRVTTIAENNFVAEVRAALPKDMYLVKNPAFFKGFEIGVSIQSVSSQDYTPKVVVEVVGSSYTYPSKELFYRLRNLFLESEQAAVVKTVNADNFRLPGLNNGLNKYPSLLTSLYPALDDPHFISSKINGNGLNTFSFLGESRFQQDLPTSFSGSAEYFDDEYSIIDVNKSVRKNNPFLRRKVWGMVLGWIGDSPVINSALSLAGNSFAKPSQRLEKQKGAPGNQYNNMVEKGMIPTGMFSEYGSSDFKSKLSVSSETSLLDSLGSQSFHSHHMTGTDDSDLGSIDSRVLSGRLYDDPRGVLPSSLSGDNNAFPSIMSPNTFKRFGGHPMHNTSNSSLNSNVSHSEAYHRSEGIASDLDSTLSHISGRSPTALLRKSPKSQVRDNMMVGSGGSLAGSLGGGSITGSISSLEFGHSRSEDEFGDDEVVDHIDDDEIEELEKKLEIAKLEARLKDLKNKKMQKNKSTSESPAAPFL